MSQTTIDSNEPLDPLSWILAALVSGLVFIRWWQPTEGTIQGDTLGLVLGWLLTLALSGWIGLRGTNWAIRLDGLQWAVLLLAGGHLLSGGFVLVTSGDKRGALNLMWEWLALAIAFPILRRMLDSVATRREWTILGLSAVVSLSAYGLIQRAVILPQTIKEYRQVRDELDEAEKLAAESGPAGPSHQTQSRIQGLQVKLLKQGLQPHMLSGSSRVMFEGRLLHSTELLGRFALANTFAGLLLVWFVILSLETFQQFRTGWGIRQDLSRQKQATGKTEPVREGQSQLLKSIIKVVFLVLCLALVGYALLLTKSRTAYLATVATLGLWSVMLSIGKWRRTWQLFLWGAICLIAIVGFIIFAGLTGGVDRLVLLEAPKSMQYRLEYWWSSLQAIGESPFLGFGPGQFRQHYLAHKLPRSSEEIADPHNLILDVWANGGVMALAGLIWLTLELFRNTCLNKEFRPKNDMGSKHSTMHSGGFDSAATHSVAMTSVDPPASRTIDLAGGPRKIAPTDIPHSNVAKRNGIGPRSAPLIQATGWNNPMRLGALSSLLIVWLLGSGQESTLLIVGLTWAICIFLMDWTLPRFLTDSYCWTAAGFGLLFHLLGAGGIGMPAITQLLIIIAIFSQHSETVRLVKIPKLAHGVSAVGGLILFTTCFVSAAQPVWLREVALEQGDLTSSPTKRDQFCRQAAIVDPLSSEPWEKLASFAFFKWSAAQKPDLRDFETAISAQQTAIERNPLAYHGHRALGEYYLARARTADSVDDQQAAADLARDAFVMALQRYPQHAELNAIAAEAFRLAGDQQRAAETAIHAIDLDEINHSAQHTDKYLSREMRIRTEELANALRRST